MDAFTHQNWLVELHELLAAGKTKKALKLVDAELAKANKDCEAINRVMADLY